MLRALRHMWHHGHIQPVVAWVGGVMCRAKVIASCRIGKIRLGWSLGCAWGWHTGWIVAAAGAPLVGLAGLAGGTLNLVAR